MKKTTITLVVLILLTIISAFISDINDSFIAIGIMVLAVLKFIGVSFYFMDLKHAHAFWKGSLFIFITLISATILLII